MPARPRQACRSPRRDRSPEQQRIAQEQEAARTSHLFATTNAGQPSPRPGGGGTARRRAQRRGIAGPDLPGPQAGLPERRRRSAHGQPGSRRGAGQHQYPPGRRGYRRIAADRAALRSAGQVTAQVTENVYDSPTGRILLIPQGARLVGQYDAQVAFGQSRALLVWNRLIMPNGRSIVLERQPGADPEGYAGLEDQVDNHWGMLFKAAILSTLLSVGSEAGTSDSDTRTLSSRPSARAPRRASARSASRWSADR